MVSTNARICGVCLAVLMAPTAHGLRQGTIVLAVPSDQPIGIALMAPYRTFHNTSLLASVTPGLSPAEQLLRRYADEVRAKKPTNIVNLYLPTDGSKARAASFIDQLDLIAPEFTLVSADVIDTLEWDGLMMFTVVWRGIPNVRQEKRRVFVSCDARSDCWLIFPHFGSAERYLDTLGALHGVFSGRTGTERASLESDARTVRIALRRNGTLSKTAAGTVAVQLALESYSRLVQRAEPTGAALHSLPSELSPIYALRSRLSSVPGDRPDATDSAFRQLMSDVFQADYAADMRFWVSRVTDGAYSTDLYTAAEYVKAIRSWTSVVPSCVVRHGNTAFVYVRAESAIGRKSLQLFPVTVADGRWSLEAIKFGTHLTRVMQAPELLNELERLC